MLMGRSNCSCTSLFSPDPPHNKPYVLFLLNVLRQPPNALTVSLSHHNRAHEDLNGPNSIKRHFALASSLIQAELMSQLVFGNSVWVVDLVAEDEKWGLGEVFHAEQSVELGFRLGEALGVLGVNEEDNTADFREVVLPQTTRLLMTAEIEGGEAAATDGQFFGCWVQSRLEDGYAVVLEHVEELLAGVSG